MRDHLRAAGVEFDDRNIRQNSQARQELLELTGELIVPVLFVGDRKTTGFDPDAIDLLVSSHVESGGGMNQPPGNSLERDQHSRVSHSGTDLVHGLLDFVRRISEELDYNHAKGQTGFRLGMHDGLRFAEEAITQLLRDHGHEIVIRQRDVDA